MPETMLKREADDDTILQVLWGRELAHPDKLAYRFLDDGEREAGCLTYGELARAARAVAAGLSSRFEPGSRILLAHSPGLEFLICLWGCWAAGMIAVPTAAPFGKRARARAESIALDACPAAVLATSAELQGLGRWIKAIALDLKPMDARELSSQQQGFAATPDCSMDASGIAMLQYTSGSTSTPKGVIVRHDRLLSNQRMIAAAMGHTEQSDFVSWLPPFHDMGLIGNLLQPIFIGSSCTFMPPAAFLRKPARWLLAISRYRAHTSGAPNFGFDLCVDSVNDKILSELDLSSWKVAYNGAEPIRQATLDRFAQAFAPAGFDPHAFYPTFGLAEATLMVSGAHCAERIAPSTKRPGSVGCGRPLAPQTLLIVEPSARVRLEEGAVGEIWIQGPNVCDGYWHDDAQTRERFSAFTADAAGPFMRTGDLGYLARGELFISGRLKDQLIVRGINYDPHDVEMAAAAALTASSARHALAAIQSDSAELMLVCEWGAGLSRETAEVVAARMRQAVADALEIDLDSVIFVRAASVPRTSSGKVRRAQCRQDFLDGNLRVLHTCGSRRDRLDQPPSREALRVMNDADRLAELLRYLTTRVAEVLRCPVSQLDSQTSLASYGWDSLSALTLAHEIENDFGVTLPERLTLDNRGIEAIARCVAGGIILTVELQAEISANGRDARRLVNEYRYALSVGQQSFWFVGQLSPRSSALNLSLAAYVEPVADVAALRRCLEMSLARHEVLSSRVEWFEGELHQVSANLGSPQVQLVDAQGWSAEHLGTHLTELALRPFDLRSEVPVRALLLTCGQNRCAIGLVVHHLAADFRSLCIVLRDAVSMYQHAVRSEAIRSRRPALPFEQFARAERALLQSPRGLELSAYWKSQLAGEITPLELPFAKAPTATAEAAAGLRHRRLSQRVAQELRSLAARNGTTLYVVSLTVFAALLHRYTAKTDILIGSPVGLRSETRFAETVGYLVNVLPYRFDLSGDPSVHDFLVQVRDVVSRAIEHADLPLARIVESLDVARDASTTPLIQVLFSWQKAPFFHDQGLTGFALRRPGARAELGGMRLEQLPLPPVDAQYDLTLMLGEDSGELWAALEYRLELFDAETAERVLLDFERFADAAVYHEYMRLSMVPLIDAPLRAALVRRASGPPAAALKATTLGERFRQIARRWPHRVALTMDNAHYSYGTLDYLSEVLASRLIDEGIEVEQTIALIAVPSARLMIAMLGALKAGVAYLPIDPGVPLMRQRQMLSEAHCVALLYGPGLTIDVSALEESRDFKVLSIDDSCKPASKLRCRAVDSFNAAYVIHTSGSSGSPKCVVVEHAALLNLFAAFEPWLPESRHGLRWTVFHAASFDLSVWEIFGAWLSGGQLVIVGPQERASAAQFARLVDLRQIQVLSLTPSTLQALLAVWRFDGLKSALLRLVVGGEPTSPELARRLNERKLPAWNFYGPTEATVWTAACPLNISDGHVMVGGPIAGTRLSVVDEQLNPAPEGIAGELVIGGVGLARGYHCRPAATALAFRPDPDRTSPSGRLYCTGDRATLAADGIRFLGRKDRQIKLRGFRADLVEVERVLQEAPGVLQAAAIVEGATQAARHLVCFVVPSNQKARLDADALADWMRSRLPAYMVPSAIVPLESLPRNPHGKIDHAALNALASRSPAIGGHAHAPATDTQERVRRVWLRVLRIPTVGMHENFFDIGGHSLAMTHMQQQLSDEFTCSLSLIELYRGSTVFEHARLIEGARTSAPLRPGEDIRAQRLAARNRFRERTLLS